MRRVLIPLDGSKLAESILPEARRLGGPDGELILVREANQRAYDVQGIGWALDEVRDYLERQAGLLRAEGVKVWTQTLFVQDVALAIDQAAKIFEVDLIACATHGRSPLGRLVHGGVAWKAVTHSSVPVLLRHAHDEPQADSVSGQPEQIMVPLDGSIQAERALPFAQELALELDVPLLLIRVVATLPVNDAPRSRVGLINFSYTKELEEAQAYLERIAAGLSGAVHVKVCLGGVVDRLVEIADASPNTYIVMAGQGRNALSRVIVGSVTDSLIQRLHSAIIVIPTLASGKLENDNKVAAVETASVGV